jgi:hypothetical protein
MKLLRRVVLGVFVLAAIAAAVAWTFPADLAWRLGGQRFAPLVLHDVGGTIWNGHAASTELFGQDLGALDWTLHADALLRGVAAADVHLAGATVSAHGTIEREASARFAARDFVVTLPARLVAPALGIPTLDLLGSIEIDVDRAELAGFWPTRAAGSARWHDAGVSGAAQARFGDLAARFATAADGSISGSVHDLGGPLELSGTFSASLRRYTATARLAPRDANAQLAEALQYIGQPQADGSRELIIQGRQAF